MSECNYCQNIRLSELYAYAQEHNGDYFAFSGRGEPLRFQYRFPSDGYYKHHRSWMDLAASARKGCQLCRLIHDGFLYQSDELRQSVEDKIASGDQTDVRICLDSYMRFPGKELLPVFDALLVQVGEQIDDESEGEQTTDTLPTIIPFQLIRPREADSKGILGKLRIGRLETDPDLGSDNNFELARQWLCECLLNHVDPNSTEDHNVTSAQGICGASPEQPLPSRVIDVGSCAKGFPRLHITNAERAQYIALSHCWGGGSSLMLTQSNINSMLQSIPMESAPANFKDAMAITRELGFRYLWIDSLCIIQDSPTDWETEAAKMRDVYKNATLTIAASASASTTTGILNRYSTSHAIPLQPRCRLRYDESDSGEICLERKAHPEESLDYCFSSSFPLATRGWVLQEQMLSSRTLYYGQRQIYWSCMSSRRSADSMPESVYVTAAYPNQYIPLESTEATSQGSALAEGRRAIFNRWYGIVETYAVRELTKATDKFPALSGLAEEFNRFVPDANYVAGLWDEDLLDGLLWYSTMPEARRVECWRAPSWSWASVEDELIFASKDDLRVEGSHNVVIKHVEVVPAGPSVYGALKSCYLILQGLTLDIYRSKEKYKDGSWVPAYLWKDRHQNKTFKPLGDHELYEEDMYPKPSDEGAAAASDIPEHPDGIQGDWFLALLISIFEQRDADSSANPHLDSLNLVDLTQEPIADHQLWVYALLLRSVDPKTTTTTEEKADDEEGIKIYERVGLMRFDLRRSSYVFGNEWHLQTLKLV